MSRPVGIAAIAVVLLAAAGTARADDVVPDQYEEPYPEIGEAPDGAVGERELSASVALAAGFGGVTPGGLRLTGAYLYQLSDLDWFDGGLAFTFGSGGAECFRDRADDLICEHGIADGVGLDLFAGVRRFLPGQGEFRPWVRPGLGLRLVRFGDDDLTGVGAFVGVAGGIRARINDRVAIGGRATFQIGAALFGDDYGLGVQADLAIGADVELQFP